MTALRTIRAPIAAILIIQTAALVARSYLELQLQADGYEADFAKDLSYLVVPPILAVLMFPILKEHKGYLRSLFQRHHLRMRLVLAALAVGLFMRIAWWCQLVLRISFGITQNADTDATIGPSFAFGCPPLPVVVLGVVVMAILVPVVEEIINRGLIQSSLAHYGRSVAIIISAVFFAAFHPPASYFATFIAGLIFGFQFWNSRTLWFSMISHATYNGLVQLDWRCVAGQWNPAVSDLPLYWPGTTSVIGLILSLSAIVYLVRMIGNDQGRGAPQQESGAPPPTLLTGPRRLSR